MTRAVTLSPDADRELRKLGLRARRRSDSSEGPANGGSESATIGSSTEPTTVS
jgi:hypothetical protein